MAKVVKLQSCDGDLFEVNEDVVSMCATVKNMLKGKSAFRNSLGGQFSIDGSYVMLKKEGRVLASLTRNSEEEAIVCLPDVKSCTLEKVIDYCQFHSDSIPTDRERKAWDGEFVQVKQSVLCELASASYYLDIKPLVNLTSRAIATQISGKTSEEIRQTFCNNNYDEYAPVFASSLAIRSRLQRKFNRKKQEEEKEQKLLTNSQDDNRSVEDLLSFIEEGSKNNNLTKSSKKKGKKKRKKNKDQMRIKKATQDQEKDEDPEEKDEDQEDNSNSNSDEESFQEKEELGDHESSSIGKQDSEDEIDPEMEAALDKEVEEFRQRLELINQQSRDIPKLQLPISAASFVSSVVGVH